MSYAHKKKQKKTSNRRNRTAKSGTHQNSWWKRKLQVHGNTGSEHNQTSGDERKKKIEKCTSEEEENFLKPISPAETLSKE